jgi:hypothetical protein
VEPTGHHDLPVTVVIHLQGPVEAVILEVQDQVSGLLLLVADPQVLSQAEVHEAVDPVVVEQEVEEETKIIESGLSNPDYHKKWKSGLSLYC